MAEHFGLFATIPHSGEKVPDFCDWLMGLPENILMYDVDRFVDQLYQDNLQKLGIEFVKTDWHRYAADLNRVPQDVDSASVQGSPEKPGVHNRGFHWQITTDNHPLMKKPIPQETHQKLVDLIYTPFHKSVAVLADKTKKSQGLVHLDLHSMPGLGTAQHRDPGERRADIVVSDCKGKSARADFVDLVILSYVRAGFKVGYNWPYFGGRVSEQYGNPGGGHHAIQVELNRSLYMDEVTKKLIPEKAQQVKPKLFLALQLIQTGLSKISV